MLAIVLASMVYAFVFFVEVIKQYKMDKKIFWLNTSILSVTYVLWILYSLNVNIPSPSEPIGYIVKAVFQLKD